MPGPAGTQKEAGEGARTAPPAGPRRCRETDQAPADAPAEPADVTHPRRTNRSHGLRVSAPGRSTGAGTKLRLNSFCVSGVRRFLEVLCNRPQFRDQLPSFYDPNCVETRLFGTPAKQTGFRRPRGGRPPGPPRSGLRPGLSGPSERGRGTSDPLPRLRGRVKLRHPPLFSSCCVRPTAVGFI